MANYKHLLSLDEHSTNILKDQKNKSEYVRNAIKQFEISKNQDRPVTRRAPLKIKEVIL